MPFILLFVLRIMSNNFCSAFLILIYSLRVFLVDYNNYHHIKYSSLMLRIEIKTISFGENFTFTIFMCDERSRNDVL